MATGNKVIEQNAEGKLIINGNELKMVSTIAQGDAAFFKAVSPYVEGESGGGGGFSIDAGDEGRNFPLVELLGAMYQGGAEFKLVLLKKGAGSDPNDNDYQTVMEATSEGIEFKVPVKGMSGGDSSGRFFTSWQDRHRCFQAQADPASDGNLVVYDTKGTSDESQWVAIGYHKMLPLP
jgi:hypothetical protein